MKFTDRVTIAGTRRRDDGYLVADARVARTGIQVYAGWEVGKPEKDTVRVYRPEGEVFARDAMASFAHRPSPTIILTSRSRRTTGSSIPLAIRPTRLRVTASFCACR